MSARDLVDRRVLGGVRFVSAVNGLPVSHGLVVRRAPGAAVGAEVMVNRVGIHVIRSAPGFESYTRTFDERDLVPPAGLELRFRVFDPADRFLPRDFTFAVPRAMDQVGAVVDVPLYPTTTAVLADGWAVLEMRVEREIANPAPANATRVPVPGALVRVRVDADNGAVLGGGVTEWRHGPREPLAGVGEGLLAVAGIPLMRWSNRADAGVLVPSQPVRFEVRLDTAFDARPFGGTNRDRLDDPAPAVADLEAFVPGVTPNPGDRIRVIRATVPALFAFRARSRGRRTFILNPGLTEVRHE